MSHANEYRDTDNPAPKHDSTSKLPSKSSQPPIKTMAQAGLMDHDSRVYLAKKYRTQFGRVGTGDPAAARQPKIYGSDRESAPTL